MGKIELTEKLKYNGSACDVDYYSRTGRRGDKKFFAVVHLDARNQVILDSDSMLILKNTISTLFPLLFESRLI